MDRLAGIPAFEGVVAAGSFAGAARALGLSVAAVSKQVRALEDRLGVRLLHRTTRQVRLTEAGQRFHERCQRILADLEDAEREVAERQATPRGRVRVSAPMSFGRAPPRAAGERVPGGAIPTSRSTSSSTIASSISSRRGSTWRSAIAELRDSSLVARRLCASRRVLCAAPGYLARHGTPATPDELAAHRCIGYAYMASGCDWPFQTRDGRRLVRVHGPVMSNNGDVLRVLALDGCGIALLPTFLVADDLRDGPPAGSASRSARRRSGGVGAATDAPPRSPGRARLRGLPRRALRRHAPWDRDRQETLCHVPSGVFTTTSRGGNTSCSSKSTGSVCFCTG